MKTDKLRFLPAQRVLILIVAMCVFTVIGSAIIGIVVHGGITTQTLRISTVIQDCLVFILPAVVTAFLISPEAPKFLGIDRGVGLNMLLLAILALIVSIPAMNALVSLNENISLPSSLSGIEIWMRDAETRAQESVTLLLGGATVGSLIVNLLIVGVLAGFSEEIFFRGAMQSIFIGNRLNKHLAVWLTAFIFSAFHLQFFGFFPRLLLGAFFGYLFIWSRSLWLPVVIHTLNNSLVVCATWHEKCFSSESESAESLNEWGADSPILIISSIILTTIIIILLYKKSLDQHGAMGSLLEEKNDNDRS